MYVTSASDFKLDWQHFLQHEQDILDSRTHISNLIWGCLPCFWDCLISQTRQSKATERHCGPQRLGNWAGRMSPARMLACDTDMETCSMWTKHHKRSHTPLPAVAVSNSNLMSKDTKQFENDDTSWSCEPSAKTDTLQCGDNNKQTCEGLIHSQSGF